MNPPSSNRVLLTGATGYVGGRLLRVLSERGHRVRALVRRPEFLRQRSGAGVEIVQGDVMDRSSLLRAMEGVDAAYYMVHSMGSTEDFVELDREGAKNFGEVAARCGVKRIIYLGGLGDGKQLSRHLQSRQEVGEILRRSGVLVIELRASVVIGSGSLSFEMIRALVERLPVMITPRWVNIEAQPIAINDLLEYLASALTISLRDATIVEIGGSEKVSYGQLMREYARQRRLRRLMVPVPVLTPRLSSLWLGLVTPLYARTGRKLIESLRHPTVVNDPVPAMILGIHPRSVPQAIADALRNEDKEYAETRWSDSISSSGGASISHNIRLGNRLIDSRAIVVGVNASVAFRPIQNIGGSSGWYYGNWLWKLRGFIDLLIGGVGVRRGRRHQLHIAEGDTIDWWRVERLEPGRRLRLVAEMKLPGRAWLEFEVEPHGETSTIKQTAVFDPVGLFGLAYWYAVYPIHILMFRGMLSAIARLAEKSEG